MTKVSELFGIPTEASGDVDWKAIASAQQCPFLMRKCLKIRKSQPNIAIGTCIVGYGREPKDVIICPFRLLERRQIFTDCIHLLGLHEPGNELHVATEVSVPGGSVDYCLVSVRAGKAIDVCGIELQTLDTTGTVWPERQRLLKTRGVTVRSTDASSRKTFGMNWKMTAKTTLVQLHHKIETFEHIGKHLVLVAQDCLIDYMKREFSFDHLQQARIGDPMHFHGYRVFRSDGRLRLQLDQRWSTDSAGIARCLGLQTSTNVELKEVLAQVEAKISRDTVLNVGDAPLATGTLASKAVDPS